MTVVSERQTLHTLTLEEKTKRAAVDSITDSHGVDQRKLDKLESEGAKLAERKATVRFPLDFPCRLKVWLNFLLV